jgi:hypothetical protein
VSRIKTCEIPAIKIKQQIQSNQIKDEDDCLICRLMRVNHERSDIVKWIYSSKKPMDEKARIASLMTGINFDREMIECLNDPSVKKFILSE